MGMQLSGAAVSGTVMDASALHPTPPGVHGSAVPFSKASQPQRESSGVAPGTGAESVRPAPGTPILSRSSKRKADAMSPPKGANSSAWQRKKRQAVPRCPVALLELSKGRHHLASWSLARLELAKTSGMEI